MALRCAHVLSFFICGVVHFGGVQGKSHLRLGLHQQIQRLNPAAIADVAGDIQDVSPDMTLQGLDQANDDLQQEDQAPNKYNQSYAPKSPPHGPEVSPSDEKEKIDEVMAKHSDFWRPEPPGMPTGFVASSCVNACSACRINAAENLPGSCRCMATCKKGTDSSKCLRKPIGWSNDNPNQPEEVWEGKCNNGLTDCSECVNEELEKEISRCHGHPVCLHKLQTAMSKPAPERFCLNTKVHLNSCEIFTHVPKENNWKCYPTAEECQGKNYAYPYEDSFGSRNTPCLWCAASNLKDPDEMDLD